MDTPPAPIHTAAEASPLSVPTTPPPSIRVYIGPVLGVYVLEDDAGALFDVADRSGAWRHRSAHAGARDALIEVRPVVAAAIAARLGAIKGAKNPRGGRPLAPPPIAVLDTTPAEPADPLAMFEEAERRLEEALAGMRAAVEVVAAARRQFGDATRFLQRARRTAAARRRPGAAS